MQIDDSLINKNQNYINYWTAESSYKDLSRFVSDYITRIEDSFGVTYSHEDIFKREFDDEAVEVIFSEGFDSVGMGQAIMNRLLKAAGHKVIRL